MYAVEEQSFTTTADKKRIAAIHARVAELTTHCMI
jgi:hypothetical protein